ncbi:eukaryotic translation initiation factor 4 gamma 3-like isoform X2 [Clytia hemisphaerica]|uniref:Uncharacterized protein n=1 Tax=Clytia hemisphaerica TaxID=252671 RepID=A0A7M5WX11_9CNID
MQDKPIRGSYQPRPQYVSDSNQMMQAGTAPVRGGLYNFPNNTMQIRGGYSNGPRMQYQNQQYVQMQQQDVMHQQGYIQNYNQNVYGSSPNYHPQQFQQVYRPQQPGYPPAPQVYVLQQGATPFQPQVQLQAQQMQQNAQQNIPQQHPQHQQQRNVYQTIQPQQAHHSTIQQTQSHQTPESVPKKRTVIKIVDPNSGKDLTSEIQSRKKTEKQTTPLRSSTQVKISAPATPIPVSQSIPVDSDEKLKQNKANAEFAAKVAAQVAARQQQTESPEKKQDKTEETPVQKVEIKSAPVDQVDSTPKEKDIKQETSEVSSTQEVQDTKKEVQKPVEEKTESNEPISETKIEETVPETTVPETPKTEEVKTEASEIKTEAKVEPVQEPVKKIEASLNNTEPEATDEPIVNGHDENKSAFQVAKKKSNKKRLKELDAKQDSTDILSAFTDAPKKEDPQPVVEPPAPQQPKEDPTWEDKEKTIEKEVIRNEDSEEPEAIKPQQPRVEKTTIVSTEDEDEEKLQYDRDFLLKFQFNPICTSKPANLPNIDIVLDTAHQPTKPLVPGQRFTNNDFMPNFMRQSSGGRSSGGGRSSKSDRRGPPSMGGKPQKIIQLPQFEKLELKRSENAWVRPSDQDKDLPEELKVMKELERNVRAILNKLTPQKFKELVDKMTNLKIDSVSKLQMAIDLIFEKAISEPGFSVAYANMCRVLTDAFKSVPGDKSNTNFRKILLNKCQKEFEKEKQDDIQMEQDRSKTFDTEKEMKEWKEELDYKEMINRRRTLGNIRFIGELFKLKMISEKIMHECILKLIRVSKPDSMEDHLECLCKLLSTVGKQLDHEEAKPRMDQYFQQIEKIIEKKKISSRIKFALKDVIDLRANHWVPRRDEGNPKTIDQIAREAQQKAKEEEMYRQQEKLKPREPRGRVGGRDSPSVRNPTSADGWTNVPSKATRGFGPTVDASKFKIQKKNDSSDISLGPGGRPGAWSKGASGGSSSRSGSGSNTPTNEIEQKGNRFDLLSGSSDTPAPLDNRRGGSRPNSGMRKTSQGTGRRGDERNAALRAVRDLTSGSNSRNQSPSRAGDSAINSPVSGSQTPVEASLSPTSPPAVDEDKMRKKTKSTIEEFFGVLDYKEAMLCLKELDAPHLHWAFVEEAIVIASEMKPQNRVNAGKLFCRMVKDNLIKFAEFQKGMSSVIEIAPDMAVDIPRFYAYMGEILGPMIAEPSVLPLQEMKKLLEPLVYNSKAGVILAEALNTGCKEIADEQTIAGIWKESGLSWSSLLESGRNIDEFVQDHKLQYLMKTSSSSSTSHASQIQQELLLMLNTKNNEDKVIAFIDEKIPSKERATPEFICTLTDAVCRSSLTDEGSECKCNKEALSGKKRILLKYIDGNKISELHAAFALQSLATDLNHPRGLLSAFFEEFYDADLISEETFDSWQISKELPDGKGVALSEVKDFLHWLKKAEEEQNDEESAAPVTN